MNIKREDILKYGTILLIAFFFIEFFWPLLYSPKTEEQPSPSVQVFEAARGEAVANATIKSFTLQLFAECIPSGKMIGEVKNVSGVMDVASPKSNLHLIQISLSRSQRETIADVRKVLESNCVGEFKLYRGAFLKFEKDAEFKLSNGQTATISAYQFAAGEVVGYVNADINTQEKIQVYIVADFQADGSITSLAIQQVDLSAFNATQAANQTKPASDESAAVENQTIENATNASQ